ncbi:1-deoxy-D-xylulose-5-phosphate reductoisomerase [Gammaproteobacteria bacterium]|nr:1-deoxy-D-xylulose-5-phosphate reductoisomerase [Gammaproteobacteria bacterium]
MKNVAILGSTGSVGSSSLEVLRANKNEFKVKLLVANKNHESLIKQYREFRPSYIYLHDKKARQELLSTLDKSELGSSLITGEDELNHLLSSDELDIVVAAIVGIAGLNSVTNAVKSGKHILLANKESYIVAGEILNQLSNESGATIFPIDSEHSAIHQCLSGIKDQKSISKLILTGSGGPFLDRDINTFNEITPEEAISHPVWNMGPKISVDSSTMMNKCLEIIEARWLFNNKNIEVLIHPEGIVHSLVEFVDKSLVAQLSVPDMKIPIAYGLGYPSKIDSAASSVNFEIFSNLSFRQPDFQKFPSLNLARQCIEEGGNSPIVINAVNEVSVDAFLKGKIGYLDIYNLISEILDKTDIKVVKKVEDIFEQDKQSRAMAMELIGTY